MAKSLDPPQGDKNSKMKLPPILTPVQRAPGVRGRLPLPTGHVILSPEEEAYLKSKGWKPGQRLPGNIGTQVKEAREAIAKKIATSKPKPDDFVPNIPETVDIDTLPAEKQDVIRKYLDDFNKDLPQLEEAIQQSERFQQLTPGVQQALDRAGITGGVQVSDSRTAEDFQSQIDRAEGREPATGLAEDDDEDEVVEPPSEPKTPEFCPYCGWDQHDHIDQPTDQDKVLFLTAFMGDEPFRKMYTLFGGRVEVTFRGCTVADGEAVVAHVAKQVQSGKVGPTVAHREGHLAHFILSLDTVKIGEIVYPIHALADELKDDLADCVVQVQQSNAFKNQSIWNACRTAFEHFQKIKTVLETRAQDSNFWPAIAG